MFPIISAWICLLNLLCLVSCDHDETFNFEESLNNLKKEMTQLETKTTQMAEEMKNQKMMMAKMASVIQNQSEKIDQLKSNRCECQDNSTNGRTMRKRLSNENVAFSVRLTRDISVVDGMTIVFDEKVTDFGNNYDTYDGIFRAPVNGVYVFTWTIGTHSDRNEETVLVKQGNIMAYSYSDSSDNDGAQVTNTVVIQVKAGEHVMVKAQAWSVNSDYIQHGPANTFSGWLLWAL